MRRSHCFGRCNEFPVRLPAQRSDSENGSVQSVKAVGQVHARASLSCNGVAVSV